jgi:hypothetical protein
VLTPFRINTCKSVTKQTTLTTFRMNTYAKPRGRYPLSVAYAESALAAVGSDEITARKRRRPAPVVTTGYVKQSKAATPGARTVVYGKNDPFRSWPISANELEEVAMGSETNV